MTEEQIIKVIAKGMFADDADYHHGQEWDDDACFTYIRKATAALSALKAAGLAVVPVEPTHMKNIAEELEQQMEQSLNAYSLPLWPEGAASLLRVCRAMIGKAGGE